MTPPTIQILILACCISCTAEKTRFLDSDEDGYTIEAGDCDDTNPNIHPTAPEECDDIDNNCNGVVDEDSRNAQIWYQDADHDGYGSEELLYSCVQPEGFVANSRDCDDNNPLIHPQAEETLLDIGIDNRCDGLLGKEEHSFAYQEELPLATEMVYVPNFQFQGPSFFFLGEQIYQFSFDVLHLESTYLPFSNWLGGTSVRDTDFWYYETTSEHSLSANQYDTNKQFFTENTILDIISMEGFFSTPNHLTGFVLQNSNTQHLVLSEHVSEQERENDLPVLFTVENLLYIQNTPDINGDGYEELWLSFPDYGKLIFGGLNLHLNDSWTMYYDTPCREIAFVYWSQETTRNALCLQNRIAVWDIGLSGTTADHSQVNTYIHTNSEQANIHFSATDHVVIVQSQYASHLDIYTSFDNNPTQLHHMETPEIDSHVILEPQNETPYYSVFFLHGQKIHYDTTGLFVP